MPLGMLLESQTISQLAVKFAEETGEADSEILEHVKLSDHCGFTLEVGQQFLTLVC